MKRSISFVCVVLMVMVSLIGCGKPVAMAEQPKETVAETSEPIQTQQGDNLQESDATQPNVELKQSEAENQESSSDINQPQISLVEITPEVPASSYNYSEGLGIFEYNGKYGYLDSNGKVIIEPKYGVYTFTFSEGYAIVTDGNYKSAGGAIHDDMIITKIIDKQGNEIFTSDKYSFSEMHGSINNSENFHQNRAVLRKKEQVNYLNVWDVIDTSGKVIYTMTGFFPLGNSDGYYSCDRMIWYSQKEGFYRITDLDGNVVFDHKASILKSRLIYSDNLLALPDASGAWGVVDVNGKTVIDFSYEKLGFPGEGLIPFMKYKKWGYVDYKGNVVIEPQYQEAYGFSNDLAAVRIDGKLGYINKENKIVIPPTITAMEGQFSCYFDKNGLAIIYIDVNNRALIDREGNSLISSPYGIDYSGGDIVSVHDKIYKIEGLQ